MYRIRNLGRLAGAAALVALGCPSATETSATGSTGSTTGTETGSDTEAGDPALQVCHDLPEAAVAEWVEGPTIAPAGESTPARIADAGAATWALAIDLLNAIPAAEFPSLAASPASMSIALGMTTKRHSGTMCETSILEKIHAVESGDPLHNTFGASILELESRALPMGGDGENPVILSLKQSLWEMDPDGAMSVGDPIYGATLHSVNKGSAGENLAAIRTVMNCVIEVQSQGLLPDFIPQSFPKEDTTAFDANISYLQAPWRYALSSRGAQTFTLDGGSTAELDMIGTTEQELLYEDHVDFDAVSLPMRGGSLAMLFVLPDPAFANLAEFTAGLSPDALTETIASAAPTIVDLTLPKFSVAGETVDYMEPLGIECELFTLRAVLHGAAVEVDEKGVKAAAATFNENWGSGTGPPPPDVTLTFDRPFLYFIYDETTGYVLFSGRYAGD